MTYHGTAACAQSTTLYVSVSLSDVVFSILLLFFVLLCCVVQPFGGRRKFQALSLVISAIFMSPVALFEYLMDSTSILLDSDELSPGDRSVGGQPEEGTVAEPETPLSSFMGTCGGLMFIFFLDVCVLSALRTYLINGNKKLAKSKVLYLFLSGCPCIFSGLLSFHMSLLFVSCG